MPATASGRCPRPASRLLEAIATALTALVAGPVAGPRRAWRTCSGRTTPPATRWPGSRGGSPGARSSCCSRGARRTSTSWDGIRRDRSTACPAPRRVGSIAWTSTPWPSSSSPRRLGGLAAPSADALLAESEGLPLYVVEALVGGDTRAPVTRGGRTVRALLRERLATVSETASQVLAAAAVIGRSFEIGPGPGRERPDPRTRRSAPSRSSSGGGSSASSASGQELAFDFAHARFRDAAYEATSLARRRLLHRRVADLLRAETRGRDDPGRLVQIAVHERAAGRDAEAAEAFREAGLRAREVLRAPRGRRAPRDGARPRPPGRRRHPVALGEVRTAQGDYAGAIARARGRGRGRGRGRAAGDRAPARPGPRPARRPGDRREPPRRGDRRARRRPAIAGPVRAGPRAGGARARRGVGGGPGPGRRDRRAGARDRRGGRRRRGDRRASTAIRGLVAAIAGRPRRGASVAAR